MLDPIIRELYNPNHRGDSHSLAIELLMKGIENLLPHLAFFEQDGHVLRFGPNGLHPIVSFLCRAVDVMVSINQRDSKTLKLGPILTLAALVDKVVIPMTALVLAFRSSISRTLYDPWGFRDLRLALQDNADALPVSSCFFLCIIH